MQAAARLGTRARPRPLPLTGARTHRRAGRPACPLTRHQALLVPLASRLPPPAPSRRARHPSVTRPPGQSLAFGGPWRDMAQSSAQCDQAAAAARAKRLGRDARRQQAPTASAAPRASSARLVDARGAVGDASPAASCSSCAAASPSSGGGRGIKGRAAARPWLLLCIAPHRPSPLAVASPLLPLLLSARLHHHHHHHHHRAAGSSPRQQTFFSARTALASST